MSTVSIDLGARSYDIRIGADLLDQSDEFSPWIAGEQVLIITNTVVAPMYLDRLRATLSARQCDQFVLDDGETTKNLDNYRSIIDFMLAVPFDRGATVIALGGGVVGDLAGFVASTYQRGVAFIQVPTTLLSQVDSSVGGKTGVNHALGKNMIGAFYQPRRVVIDINTLATLDARQFSAGMAEVIKYGLIRDAEFFGWLENNIEAVMARQPEAIEYLIQRSCQNKSDVVQQDELEGGVRALLNLGHTFGHAIETATQYRTWLHGEAVALGTMMAADLSVRHGWLTDGDVQRIAALLQKAGLPTEPFAGVEPDQMRRLMQGDKKVLGGKLRLVVLKQIGKAEIIDDADPGKLAQTLSSYTAG